MARMIKPIFLSALGCFLCVVFLSVTGCGGPSSVDAIPRTGSNQPVLGAVKKKTAVKSSNGLDLDFIHEDHFACVVINVEKVIANSDLSDVPWDTLEDQLSKLIGAENSSLKNIERVWVVLDRDGISFGEDSEQQSPLIFVLDFKTIPNETQLMNAAQQAAEQSEGKTAKLITTKIGENRVVIGSPSLTSKITAGGSGSNLSRQLKQMKLQADIDCLVDIGPIRSTMQSMFDMIGSFGGEEVAKFTRLPELLQRVEISLSLDSKDMLEAVAYIDDEKMPAELANLANENGQSGAPSMMGGGLPFGLGGSRPGGGADSGVMISPTSANVLTEVSKEISDENLFSIVGEDRKLTLKLQRPSKLKELITASLNDAKRQIELAARVERLKKIAKAMQDYVEKHNCFPPSGIVTESADGLPSQFSWRVGLLPYLGEQELYDQFDFSKAWDSPENMAIAKQMPNVFAAVSIDESTDHSSETRWHVVGGKLGLYKGERTPKFGDISDKKIWTALVVEGGEKTAVNWIKPGSLAVDNAEIDRFGLDDENGILFLNAAFDPRIIKKNQQDLKSVLTPDGDEKIQRRDFLPILPGM